MPVIQFQTPESERICFLLVAGDDAIEQGANERDCILTGPPEESSLLEHPLSILRTDFLHVEHIARVQTGPEGVAIEVNIREVAVLSVQFVSEGPGSWQLDQGEARKVAAGIALLGKNR